jgi:hypothetical protein
LRFFHILLVAGLIANNVGQGVRPMPLKTIYG